MVTDAEAIAADAPSEADLVLHAAWEKRHGHCAAVSSASAQLTEMNPALAEGEPAPVSGAGLADNGRKIGIKTREAAVRKGKQLVFV